MRFEILMAEKTSVLMIWVVKLCALTVRYQCSSKPLLSVSPHGITVHETNVDQNYGKFVVTSNS
jgi:hypothetical protein